MKNPDTETFSDEKSTVVVWLVLVFTGFLGTMFLIGFFDSLSNIDADSLFLLVLGLVLVVFTVLFHRYAFNPHYELSDREIKIRNLFGVKAYRYEEITSLETFSKTFRPKRPGGGHLHGTLTTHHLVFGTRDGKSRTVTLPSFLDNRRILASLAERSGKTIGQLPHQYEKGLEPPRLEPPGTDSPK